MGYIDRILSRHRLKPLKKPEQTSTSMALSFEAWHRANPHLMTIFRDISLALKAQGFERGGMKMLFEKLRWEYYVQTTGGEYKLGNSLTAYYARALMLWCPELDGFFALRHQSAEPNGSYSPNWQALGLEPGGGSVDP